MTNDGFGRVCFSTDALPERDRFPIYCEEIGRRYIGLDFRTEDRAQFRAALTLQRAGALDILRSTTPALDSIRTPHLVADGDDSLCVVALESGRAVQSQRGEEHEIGPGEAVLCDAAYAGACNFVSASEFWSIRLPRRRMTALLPGVPDFAGRRLDRDDAARRLLFSALRATLDLDMNAGRRLAEHYADHIAALVALALGAEGEDISGAGEQGICTARRTAVLREIERRSGEADVSAASVAASLGVTPRYVHLLLEQTGKTFSHHVLELRLEKAAALLRDPQARRRKISDIAAQAGFGDLSYFNRSFRLRYGVTPSELRETARRGL